MSLIHPVKATLALAVLFPLAACTDAPVTIIGPDAKSADLKGQVEQGEVLHGAGIGDIITIDGGVLKMGSHYKASGKLIVEGDVPSGATLEVDGEIVVKGSVGKEAHLIASQPIAIHSTSLRHYGFCGKNPADGKGEATSQSNQMFFKNYTCLITRTFNDGLIYDDSDAGIVVTGTLDPTVKLQTWGRIDVDGETIKNRIHLQKDGIAVLMK